MNISSYYGLNITARQPERLNSWDEQTLIDEARFNATGAREFNDEQYEWLRNPNFLIVLTQQQTVGNIMVITTGLKRA